MEGGELFSQIQARGDQAFTERGQPGVGASVAQHGEKVTSILALKIAILNKKVVEIYLK